MTIDISGFSLGRQLQWSRLARDFGRTENLFCEVLERRSDDVELRTGYALLLEELGHGDKAAKAWETVAQLADESLLVAYQRSKHKPPSAFDSAAIAGKTHPCSSPELAKAVESVADHPFVPTRSASLFRHIAICGVSFSGSTILDRILGSLSGVRSIGESHWLIKGRGDHGYDLFDFVHGDPEKLLACSSCGRRCETLSFEFKRSLAADPVRWYQKIADRLETDTLVSADKNPPKLWQNDPLLRFDALVLFKSPVQAWQSQRNKLPDDQPDSFYVEQLEKYLTSWSRTYEFLTDALEPLGRKAFVCFDDFTNDPERVLGHLCATFDLAFDGEVLSKVKQGHAIGGNHRAMQRIRNGQDQITIEPLPEPTVPAEHIRIIERHTQVQVLYRRMLEQRSL